MGDGICCVYERGDNGGVWLLPSTATELCIIIGDGFGTWETNVVVVLGINAIFKSRSSIWTKIKGKKNSLKKKPIHLLDKAPLDSPLLASWRELLLLLLWFALAVTFFDVERFAVPSAFLLPFGLRFRVCWKKRAQTENYTQNSSMVKNMVAINRFWVKSNHTHKPLSGHFKIWVKFFFGYLLEWWVFSL